MTDQMQAPAVDLSKYIETRTFGVRPHIRNRRIPVADVAYNARAQGWGIAETASNFGLSEAEVAAALLYYSEHQAEIDAQEAAYLVIPPEDWMAYGDDALTRFLLRRNDVASGDE